MLSLSLFLCCALFVYMFVTQVSVYNLSIRPTTIWYCCATLGTLRVVHQKYVRICVLWEAVYTCSQQVANLATTYVLYPEPNNIYHNIYIVILNHASKSLHAVMMHMGHSGCPVEPLSVS